MAIAEPVVTTLMPAQICGEQRDSHCKQFHKWLVKKYAEYGKTGVYFR